MSHLWKGVEFDKPKQTKTAERLWSGTSQLGYDYVYASDYENHYEHNLTYKILIQIHFKKQFIYPQGGD